MNERLIIATVLLGTASTIYWAWLANKHPEERSKIGDRCQIAATLIVFQLGLWHIIDVTWFRPRPHDIPTILFGLFLLTVIIPPIGQLYLGIDRPKVLRWIILASVLNTVQMATSISLCWILS